MTILGAIPPYRWFLHHPCDSTCVDEASLDGLKRVVRTAIPVSAILLPAAFFLSVLRPDATEPNALIYLTYVGAVVLVVGLLIVGVGLIKKPTDIAE
jgi:hypothetical protein